MKLTNNLTNETLIDAYKAQGFDVDQIEVISEVFVKMLMS